MNKYVVSDLKRITNNIFEAKEEGSCLDVLEGCLTKVTFNYDEFARMLKMYGSNLKEEEINELKKLFAARILKKKENDEFPRWINSTLTALSPPDLRKKFQDVFADLVFDGYDRLSYKGHGTFNLVYKIEDSNKVVKWCAKNEKGEVQDQLPVGLVNNARESKSGVGRDDIRLNKYITDLHQIKDNIFEATELQKSYGNVTPKPLGATLDILKDLIKGTLAIQHKGLLLLDIKPQNFSRMTKAIQTDNDKLEKTVGCTGKDHYGDYKIANGNNPSDTHKLYKQYTSINSEYASTKGKGKLYTINKYRVQISDIGATYKITDFLGKCKNEIVTYGPGLLDYDEKTPATSEDAVKCWSTYELCVSCHKLLGLGYQCAKGKKKENVSSDGIKRELHSFDVDLNSKRFTFDGDDKNRTKKLLELCQKMCATPYKNRITKEKALLEVRALIDEERK